MLWLASVSELTHIVRRSLNQSKFSSSIKIWLKLTFCLQKVDPTGGKVINFSILANIDGPLIFFEVTNAQGALGKTIQSPISYISE